MIDFSTAKNFAKSYRGAQPFPHIVMDNFLQDESLTKTIVAEMLKFDENPSKVWGVDSQTQEFQDKKWFAPWNDASLANMPKVTKQVLSFLNSQMFLNYLTDLTGIENLIADDNYAGGGVHRIFSGGRLCVHTDFALHPDLRHLHRRLNLLVYLNDGWEAAWGGSLRLYKHDTKEMTHDIEPFSNRAVIFNTTNKALHGHPHPLACPTDKQRMSLALYYFTEEPPPEAHEGNLSALWHKDADPIKQDPEPTRQD